MTATPSPPYDPGEHTVAEVQEYVNANPDQTDAVREAEAAGKARVTLLDWLDQPWEGEAEPQASGYTEGGTLTDAGGRPQTDAGGRIINKDNVADVP